ncbi:metalloendoproteinase 2-MMP-like isoform X3 [Hevea brasiliensis]|uniref:metalloendoproteinase 2-MMP-like isoform X3 n=1 Tax=Hevea brasiliensis TaxID=3981 RepID=UPI0025CDC2A5|nr:metalloendoproteinase 2-MMP-like isoform X3 [Hevea brasiliensis]
MASHILIAFFLFSSIQPFLAQSRTLKSENQDQFKSFQNLEGAGKGSTVEGLSKVKQYLKNLGYYPTETNLVTDHFDEVMESALKTYQNYYRLKVTGKLDSDTIKEMMIPRCGVPDNINHPTKQSHHKPGKFNMVQVIDEKVLKSVCSKAFKKWADVSQFTFEEAPAGSKSDIVIGFYSGDHGDRYPFDGPRNTLAHAFAPEDGRFHYDADENWSTNPDADQVDLETVAIHEIGHLLGLGHSQDKNAIMYRAIPYGTTKRHLSQDDIDGIHALYSSESK